MYVRAGRPAFARSCVGVHKSTSLMSSSLLLQQCPACLLSLTWIVFVIGGSWCLVGCCRLDLFKIARSILVYSLYTNQILFRNSVFLKNKIPFFFFHDILIQFFFILVKFTVFNDMISLKMSKKNPNGKNALNNITGPR